MKFAYHLKQLILATGDLISFSLGFLIALTVRHWGLPVLEDVLSHVDIFVIVFLIWIVINYINGLYDLSPPTDKTFARRFMEAGLISLVVGIIFFYITPSRALTPKTILMLTVVFGYGCSYAWRWLYHHAIGARKLQLNILLLGLNDESREILAITQKQPEKGYRVVAIVDPGNEIKGGSYQGIDVYHSLSALRPAITTHNVHLVAVAEQFENKRTMLTELYHLLFWPVQILDVTSFYETLTGRIPPSIFSESWFLKNLNTAERPIYEKMRLLIDYLLTVTLGIVFLGLLPLVALLIKLTSAGPIFYKQKRVGRFGEHFTIYKFRTMYALTDDGSAEPDGAQFATKNDKRVTSVGKILRKTRIDEFPQVINLLRGELTFIGPRPERPEIVEKLEAKMPYYSLRHIAKPGITGWAAINQHYTDTLETSLQKLQYDLFYIKNRSILLDLSILLKTVNVVIRRMGQ